MKKNNLIILLLLIICVSFIIFFLNNKNNKFSFTDLTGSVTEIQSNRPSLSSIGTECVSGKMQAKISWTPVSWATSYVVSQNKPNDTGWPQIAKNITDTYYTDTNFSVIPGIYSYQIKAIADGRKATFSNIQSVKIVSCSQDIVPPVVSSTPIVIAPVVPPKTDILSFPIKEWGAYTGWQENDLLTLESQIGKVANIRAIFTHWGNEKSFPLYLSKVTKDKILLIFWEPSDYNNTSLLQPLFSYDTILAGNWDSYIKTFANDAKLYGGQVIIVPFSEMNGNWNPWSGTIGVNTPEKHIAAYQYIRKFFNGISNVKFGWAPNHDSVPNTAGNQLEKYYPGDQYVDYVGVDGFNFSKNNSWNTFDQIFSSTISKLKIYNKPIYIFSFASGGSGVQKASWITDALTVQIPKYSEIKGWVWFNERKEEDWRIWSDQTVLKAFKDALK
jgi:hypothetical protein